MRSRLRYAAFSMFLPSCRGRVFSALSGFRVQCIGLRVCTSVQADLAMADKQKPGKVIVFPISSSGKLLKESQVLIDGGGPRGEELFSIAIYGEFDCASRESLRNVI